MLAWKVEVGWLIDGEEENASFIVLECAANVTPSPCLSQVVVRLLMTVMRLPVLSSVSCATRSNVARCSPLIITRSSTNLQPIPASPSVIWCGATFLLQSVLFKSLNSCVNSVFAHLTLFLSEIVHNTTGNVDDIGHSANDIRYFFGLFMTVLMKETLQYLAMFNVCACFHSRCSLKAEDLTYAEPTSIWKTVF